MHTSQPSSSYHTNAISLPQYLNFSSGGVRGVAFFASLWVLRTIFRQRLAGTQADYFRDYVQGYAGVSAGAIVAFMLACEMTLEQIYFVHEQIDFAKVLDRLNFTRAWYEWGLCDLQWARQIMTDVVMHQYSVQEITFQQLFNKSGKMLSIGVTNYSSGHFEVHNRKTTPGFNVVDSVLASMCIPILFTPVEIQGQKYVDGDVLRAYCPWQIAFPGCINAKKILTIHLTNPIEPALSSDSFFGFLRRLLFLAGTRGRSASLSSSVISDEKSPGLLNLPSQVSGTHFQLTAHEKFELMYDALERTVVYFFSASSSSASTTNKATEFLHNFCRDFLLKHLLKLRILLLGRHG
jgi:hypothetical protein